MKNVRIIAVLALSSLVLLGSCGRQNRKAADKKADKTIVETVTEKGVTMVVNPGIYTSVPEKVELTVYNNTSGNIQFGADYAIERVNDENIWQELEFSHQIAVIAIMYILPPGESEKYDIYLYPEATKYTPGLYRVRKNIGLNDNETVIYYAEFEIQ